MPYTEWNDLDLELLVKMTKCLTKCARRPHKVLHWIPLLKSQSMTNLLSNINVLRHFQVSYSRRTCSNYSTWSSFSRKVSIVTILYYTFQYGESRIYQPLLVLMVVFLVYRQVPHRFLGFWIHKKLFWSVTFSYLNFFTFCFYDYIFVLSRKWMSAENSIWDCIHFQCTFLGYFVTAATRIY